MINAHLAKGLILSLLLSNAVAQAVETPATPKTFTEAKKVAAQVYKGQEKTFYCGCDYNNEKRIDHDSCGYTVRSNKKRAERLEWEHVVPAHAFGHTRECWREPICETKKGEKYKGRRCCGKIDPVFRAMESDLHNLVPAVGEINADRSNYTFTVIPGELREYGMCDMEIENRKAEPPAEVRGDIARTYFYMHHTYGLPISNKQLKLFTVWDSQDPVDDWEIERNARITEIQGVRNPYVPLER